MKLEIRPFRTKVARRIFMLFILCAIVPIAALALISYAAVRKQLLEQSQFRLRQECKDAAVSHSDQSGEAALIHQPEVVPYAPLAQLDALASEAGRDSPGAKRLG